MRRAMEIKVDVQGLGQASAGLLRLAGNLDQVADKLQRVGTAGGGVGRGSGLGLGGGAGSGGAGGPVARLLAAQNNLAGLVSGGASPAALFDARFRVAQAQQAATRAGQVLNPAGPASFGSRLMGAIGSSRVSFGAGGVQLMPLVNRLAALSGPAGIAVTALAGFGVAVQQASQRLVALRDAGTVSGGSARDVAGLVARGMAPGDIAGAAAGLRDRIRTDPLARMEAMRAGMGAGALLDPKLTGSTNSAQFLEQGLHYLEGITDRSERHRAALRLEMESYLPLLDISKQMRAARLAEGKLAAQIGDEGTLRAAKDLESGLRGIGNGFGTLGTIFGKVFLPDMVEKANQFAAAMGNINQTLDRMGPGLQAARENPYLKILGAPGRILGGDPAGGFGELQSAFGTLFGGKAPGASDPHLKAVRENTAALDRAAHLLGNPGTFGGGSRAAGVGNWARRSQWHTGYGDMDPAARFGLPPQGWL